MSNETHRPAVLALVLAGIGTACPGETATTAASHTDPGSSTTEGTSTGAPGSTGATTTTTTTTGAPTTGAPTTGDPTTGAPTTGDPTTGTPTTGELCPPGALGCPCLPGQVCQDTLVCVADLCAEAPTRGCGDGRIDPGETCDAGPDNGPGKACKLDCTLNVCGDGDQGPGEECDDGDVVGGDGCGATCLLETCGDGVVGPGEQCDDGDQNDGDGCDADCTWTPCSVLWQKSYPLRNFTGHGHRIATDVDRNIVVVGTRNVSQIDSRALVLKLDADGVLLWTQIAIDTRSAGYGVAITPEGAIIAAGLDHPSGFLHDMTRRLAPDGTLGWLKQEIIAENSSDIHGSAMTPDGAVIVAGARSLSNPWLARVNAGSGAVEWIQTATVPGSTQGRYLAVIVDAAGAIYATGITTINGVAGLLVRKFDVAGVHQWAVTVPPQPPALMWGKDIDLRPGGGLAVVGEISHNDPNNNVDIWTGAFDSDGALLWSDTHDGGMGTSYDSGEGVAVGEDGRIHAVGHISADFYRGIYRQYDSDGDLLCSLSVDASPGTHTEFRDVAIDADGFPVITGYAASSVYVAKLTP